LILINKFLILLDVLVQFLLGDKNYILYFVWIFHINSQYPWSIWPNSEILARNVSNSDSHGSLFVDKYRFSRNYLRNFYWVPYIYCIHLGYYLFKFFVYPH
jgi:hypothetical protein